MWASEIQQAQCRFWFAAYLGGDLVASSRPTAYIGIMQALFESFLKRLPWNTKPKRSAATPADWMTSVSVDAYQLPDEMWIHIFSFLDVEHLPLCALTCKDWRALVNEDGEYLCKYGRFRA